MKDDDHPAGAEKQWYDDITGKEVSDPRVGASQDEIAHWNKVEAENGGLTPLVIRQNQCITEFTTSGTQV